MKSLVVLLALISTQVFAWGPTGHRVVGEIAETHLDEKVLKASRALLKGESLAQVSTWPDEIKSDPKSFGHTFKWHYTDWPEAMEKHDESHSSGKLISSIKRQLEVLKDKKASSDKKAFALKFLVHLVGDLHMPLHVGNGSDRGGNYCKVFFHNRKTSLHELWDEGMLDFNKLSFTEISRFLKEKGSDTEIKSWRSGDISTWAKESKEIRGTIYPDEVKKRKKKKDTLSYCDEDVSKKLMPRLSWEYSYKFMPVVEKRLHQAGVRLALLLNEALK